MPRSLHVPKDATHVVKVEDPEKLNWEIWGYACGFEEVAELRSSAAPRKSRVEVVR